MKFEVLKSKYGEAFPCRICQNLDEPEKACADCRFLYTDYSESVSELQIIQELMDFMHDNLPKPPKRGKV